MLVALDVGNSNITLGVIRDGDVAAARHAATRTAITPDELEVLLDGLLKQDGAALDEVDQIVLASVVPALAASIASLARGRGIRLLRADETTIPIPIRVEQPGGVGDDRLVNAFAASRLFGKPAIVVDLGTATTFDVVAADGSFVGGAIAPGVELGVEALAGSTAQLPRVPLALPQRAIGGDTVSAIQSGAVLGHVGLVTELLRAMARELTLDGGPPPKVILTGGLSRAAWASAIPGVDVIDPLLTLRGLAILQADLAREPAAART